ncbi:glutamate racemase [Aestuariicella hydrocarbonica]|uniref:Glutamate racemase n=1 Tax=Pseudomaricurvus hydrocarbonicus TaxID=1470433 RepID=A0A9E5MPV4_9GAMM|nr:glutamate racemase [Aestuariicella hydrocarbonica]NHO68138.1 glutamate racemase [Aestuariicella hydrocarbonica]
MKLSPAHILVFDSGLGGSTVMQAIQARLPYCRFSYALDDAWFPFGEKSDAQLLPRILAYFEALLEQARPDLVVIACNTASTLALDHLRQRFEVPFVGVVPAIKPALELSRSGVVGLLATPATVRRDYVDRLWAELALTQSGLEAQGRRQLIKFSCPALVTLAEARLRGKAFDELEFERAVAAIKAQAGAAGVDVFVLGCTHFPALTDRLSACWPEDVQWLDSGDAIARRVEFLLRSGGLPNGGLYHESLRPQPGRAASMGAASGVLYQTGRLDVEGAGKNAALPEVLVQSGVKHRKPLCLQAVAAAL